MSIQLVPNIVDSESFIVISEQQPDPNIVLDWFWHFSPSEEPQEFLLSYQRVWIRAKRDEVRKLRHFIEKQFRTHNIYLSRDVFMANKGTFRFTDIRVFDDHRTQPEGAITSVRA